MNIRPPRDTVLRVLKIAVHFWHRSMTLLCQIAPSGYRCLRRFVNDALSILDRDAAILRHLAGHH
jgi:hypothetical protein